MDRKLLLTIINKFNGGPVGVENLATAISEEGNYRGCFGAIFNSSKVFYNAPQGVGLQLKNPDYFDIVFTN